MTAKTQPKSDSADVLPDAWDRFERAVDAAVRSGPKHRESTAEIHQADLMPEVIPLQRRPPYELTPEQFSELQWESFRSPHPRR